LLVEEAETLIASLAQAVCQIRRFLELSERSRHDMFEAIRWPRTVNAMGLCSHIGRRNRGLSIRIHFEIDRDLIFRRGD